MLELFWPRSISQTEFPETLLCLKTLTDALESKVNWTNASGDFSSRCSEKEKCKTYFYIMTPNIM